MTVTDGYQTVGATTVDEDTDVWSEVWSEATPGMEGGLRLYLEEITSLVCPLLQSQSWPTRAQAARAMETVAEKLGCKDDGRLSKSPRTVIFVQRAS